MPCSVLPGSFGKYVQGILAVISMATLGYKWRTDHSGRSRLQFIMDTFKNCSGAASLHFTNLLFARFLAPVLKGGDECHWYFIEIMIDTTLGVYIEFYLLMRIIDGLTAGECHETASDLSEHAVPRVSTHPTGEQASDPESRHGIIAGEQSSGSSLSDVSWVKYAKQVIMWLLIVTAMKAVMVVIMIFEAPQLLAIASFVLKPVDSHPKIELLLVMVLTPAIMNSLQFWLQDNIFVDAARNTAEARKMKSILRKNDEETTAAQEKLDQQARSNRELESQSAQTQKRFSALQDVNARLQADNQKLQSHIEALMGRRASYWDTIVAPVGHQLIDKNPEYMQMRTLSKHSGSPP